MPRKKARRLEPMEKISILLHEYDSLRSEVVNQSNHTFQLLAIGGVVFVFFASQAEWSVRFWFLLAGALAALLFWGWAANAQVLKLARRLRMLEGRINALAGERLLEYETRWGGAVTGFLPRGPLPPGKTGEG